MNIVNALVPALRPIRRPAKVLYWGAAFWLTSAVVHVIALVADDWAWAGAVSFRKPVTFSVSIGLLLATSGWILDRLPDRPRLASVLAWTLLISSTIEVALIAVQSWRGRASHFNTLEAGDAMVFAAMGAAVGVMAICLLTLLVWSIIKRPSDPLAAIAVIGGMAMVATGLGLGQWIIELGNEYVGRRGLVPDTVTYGQAGVAKFPHAVAMHGIQVFIVGAVMLRQGSHSERVKRSLMWMIVASYWGILVFASAQTIVGRAPLEPGIWTLGLVLSAIGVGLGLALATRGVGKDTENADEVGLPVP